MFQILLELLFSWLPFGLWVGVWAVLSVAFLIVMIKILTVLLNVFAKFIGLLIP